MSSPELDTIELTKCTTVVKNNVGVLPFLSFLTVDDLLLILYTLTYTATSIISLLVTDNPQYSEKTKKRLDVTIQVLHYVSAGIVAIAIIFHILYYFWGKTDTISSRLTTAITKGMTLVYLLYVALSRST